jgi:hypothetical protein
VVGAAAGGLIGGIVGSVYGEQAVAKLFKALQDAMPGSTKKGGAAPTTATDRSHADLSDLRYWIFENTKIVIDEKVQETRRDAIAIAPDKVFQKLSSEASSALSPLARSFDSPKGRYRSDLVRREVENATHNDRPSAHPAHLDDALKSRRRSALVPADPRDPQDSRERRN